MTPREYAAQLGEGVTSTLAIESVEKLIARAIADERMACAAIVADAIAAWPNCDCGKREIIAAIGARSGEGV